VQSLFDIQRLEQFAYIPVVAKEKGLAYLAGMAGASPSPESLEAALAKALNDSLNAGTIKYYQGTQLVTDDGQADSAIFDTGFTTRAGETINCKFVANKNVGFQKWFGLFFEIVQAVKDGYTVGDLYFRTWGEEAGFLEQVAAASIPERWTYQDYNTKQRNPVLRAYLEYTFQRLKEQNKLMTAGDKVIFNTGLINLWFKEIYVISELDDNNPGRLVNARPCLETDREFVETFKGKRPAMATFFSRINEVIFDPDLEVITDDQHIIDDNFERIPEKYRQAMGKAQIYSLFRSAVEFAKIMARRNYKLIVPQFFHGKIQFLMPIYLSAEFTGAPDFALALERIGNNYRGNTILTLDMAYQNARLIATPDTTWLDPNPDAPEVQ
jgi:hypothetical protein